MRIMLTGGSGFIGKYVLRNLLDEGQKVNVLSRDPSKLVELSHPNMNVFSGNICNADSVSRSMAGCCVVVHLAALVSTSAPHLNDYVESNLRGTRNLLDAALRNNITKFVFTSSLSAHDIAHRPIIDEECLLNPSEYFSPYASTKAGAEELVVKQARSGVPYVVIYPTRVFGIGPLTDSNGATKAIQLYLRNRLPFLIEGGSQFASWAFVEDVARGIAVAATNAVANQKYILGGENKTLAEVYAMADVITRKSHLMMELKEKTALLMAGLLESQGRIFRKKPFITKQWLRYILESQKISSGKAIAELNYRITHFETALERTINWLQSRSGSRG